MKAETKFMQEISKIKEPTLLIGLAKILRVPLFTDNKEPHDFSQVFENVMHAYAAAPRKLRRELLQIIKQANKQTKIEEKQALKKEKLNANNTPNPESTEQVSSN